MDESELHSHQNHIVSQCPKLINQDVIHIQKYEDNHKEKQLKYLKIFASGEWTISPSKLHLTNHFFRNKLYYIFKGLNQQKPKTNKPRHFKLYLNQLVFSLVQGPSHLVPILIWKELQGDLLFFFVSTCYSQHPQLRGHTSLIRAAKQLLIDIECKLVMIIISFTLKFGEVSLFRPQVFLFQTCATLWKFAL